MECPKDIIPLAEFMLEAANRELKKDVKGFDRETQKRLKAYPLPENIQRRLLHNYIRFQPQELSDYIRQSVKRNVQPLKVWMEWLDIGDWMRLATNLSLSRAELLQQIVDYLYVHLYGRFPPCKKEQI